MKPVPALIAVCLTSATFCALSACGQAGNAIADEKQPAPAQPEKAVAGESGDAPASPVTTTKTEFKMPSDDELQKKLTPIQYKVTQKEGTEPPFKNEYWDNKKEGIYVDIVSGEPLFSSTHKFESGTGWPSFWQPVDKNMIVEKEDRKLFSVRTEVRSKNADSHLGHVFADGPKPTGMRYCINSASLRFVPKEQLKTEGYAELLSLFEDQDEAAEDQDKQE